MLVIRKFKPQDLEEVLQLFYETVHSIGARYYNQEQVATWAPKHLDKQKWLQKLQEHSTYVALLDGVVVGFGDISHDGYLDHLYTHKDYQAKGIALALLKKLEDEARNLGLKEIATEASIAAKPLAERRGYIVVEEQRKMLRGVEFINYRMKKKL